MFTFRQRVAVQHTEATSCVQPQDGLKQGGTVLIFLTLGMSSHAHYCHRHNGGLFRFNTRSPLSLPQVFRHSIIYANTRRRENMPRVLAHSNAIIIQRKLGLNRPHPHLQMYNTLFRESTTSLTSSTGIDYDRTRCCKWDLTSDRVPRAYTSKTS